MIAVKFVQHSLTSFLNILPLFTSVTFIAKSIIRERKRNIIKNCEYCRMRQRRSLTSNGKT